MIFLRKLAATSVHVTAAVAGNSGGAGGVGGEGGVPRRRAASRWLARAARVAATFGDGGGGGFGLGFRWGGLVASVASGLIAIKADWGES